MNTFKIEINNIQNITNLKLEINLNSGQLMCIIGKNGVGKTTFVKSIANLLKADIFKTTSSPYIFKDDSKITYNIDGKDYIYTYNKKLQTIDSKDIIESIIKDNIVGELPLPHGERFNFFQTISGLDKDIRQKYITKDYKKPEKLITWYQNIYESNKFDTLKEVTVSNKKYYFLPQENNRYIREDYFSSGEYFILSIYRLIQQQKKLIVIDELDISLDASAQVNLLKELRDFCQENTVTLIFTTHSLAIMKMLKDDELHYLENTDGQCKISKKSYNYIKGILYQFKGWDKYILTEDKCLVAFIKWLLEGCQLSKEHIIIPIGTANSVIALMNINKSEGFFSIADNVISVLDGDQKNAIKVMKNVLLLPFKDVEKELKQLYDSQSHSNFFQGVKPSDDDKKGKDLFNKLTSKYSQNKIFEFITESNKQGVEKFKRDLQGFINQ